MLSDRWSNEGVTLDAIANHSSTMLAHVLRSMAGSSFPIKFWWVDANITASGDGKTPETCFKTLEEALTVCENTQDDWIFIRDYSGSTNEVVIANAFVHIIGFGLPGMPYPRIQASTSGEAGLVLGDAADRVEIANVFLASTGAAAGIEFNGSGGSYACWIHDCILGRTGNTCQDGIEIMSGGAAPYLLVEDCGFGDGLASSITRDGVRFSGNATGSIIRNNRYRSVDGIGLNYIAGVTSPAAYGNIFQLKANGVGDAIDVASAVSDGHFHGNKAYFGYNAASSIVFRDQGTGNDWGDNSPSSNGEALVATKTVANWTAAAQDLFVITGGPIKVLSLVGTALTDIRDISMSLSLIAAVTTPSANNNIASALQCQNDDAGHIYTVNATFGGALVATSAGVVAGNASEFVMPIGTINMTSTAIENAGGSIKWEILYQKLSVNSDLVPA